MWAHISSFTSRASTPSRECWYRSWNCLHRSGECLHRSGECSHRSGECRQRSGVCLHRSGECLRRSGECLHRKEWRVFTQEWGVFTQECPVTALWSNAPHTVQPQCMSSVPAAASMHFVSDGCSLNSFRQWRLQPQYMSSVKAVASCSFTLRSGTLAVTSLWNNSMFFDPLPIFQKMLEKFNEELVWYNQNNYFIFIDSNMIHD